jgi:hypothetical protein
MGEKFDEEFLTPKVRSEEFLTPQVRSEDSSLL